MTKVVHLFPDTNVFVQCPPFEQLDWSTWREFDEVHLIISRPVQAEIDNLKNKGGDRLVRRARRASSLLRGIIIGGQDYLPVRPAEPAVKMFIRAALRPSPDLGEVLDYSRTDDQLVGTAHAFVQQNPGADARVLTHDTGPMASAQMVGVTIAPVPDDWLLPPEPSEADKRIRSLEAEVARLKDTEPKFSVACIDADGNELCKLEFECVNYGPLTSAEVSTLLEKLQQQFPLAQDFGPRERIERPVPGIMGFTGLKQIFTPATEKEIQEYQDKYEKWLKQCEDMLRSLDRALQARVSLPVFIFSASNDGTRPASDALVTFRAKGRFGIMPPPYRSDEDDDETSDEGDEAAPALPTAPSAPRGLWTNELESLSGALAALQRFPRGFEPTMARANVHEHLLRIPSLPKPRDPNLFYYKPDRPSFPGEQFSLECQQWRHGLEPEQFIGQIHYDYDEEAESISGAIECQIHAENLSQCAKNSCSTNWRSPRQGS